MVTLLNEWLDEKMVTNSNEWLDEKVISDISLQKWIK